MLGGNACVNDRREIVSGDFSQAGDLRIVVASEPDPSSIPNARGIVANRTVVADCSGGWVDASRAGRQIFVFGDSLRLGVDSQPRIHLNDRERAIAKWIYYINRRWFRSGVSFDCSGGVSTAGPCTRFTNARSRWDTARRIQATSPSESCVLIAARST